MKNILWTGQILRFHHDDLFFFKIRIQKCKSSTHTCIFSDWRDLWRTLECTVQHSLCFIVKKSSSWKWSNTVIVEPYPCQASAHTTVETWFIYNSCMSVFYFVQIQQVVTSRSLLCSTSLIDTVYILYGRESVL